MVVAPPQISNYGSVSFEYPIEVPPGRAGVEPKIALTYSSSGGDGWLGIGWNLGLGSISRSTQYGPLKYDHRDVFTVGGRQLVKISGPSGSANGVYRLEIEDGSFSRYELSQVAGGGVWTIYDQSGGRQIYGESGNARIAHPSDTTKVYSWQLSRSIDKNGNFLSVSYDDTHYAQKRVLYLKEIRYTGNENENFSARQYVRFVTKPRPDAYLSTAPGFIMQMDRLLDKIEVGWHSPSGPENTLWSYDLQYEISADSNRPLLQEIRTDRFTTTPRFHYQEAQHSFVWRQVMNLFASDPETNPEATQTFEGDFNGDGISDFCFFNPISGNWKVAQSNPSGPNGNVSYTYRTYGNRFQGFDSPQKIQWFKGNVTGDYNGDSRSDIAFYLPQSREFWVAESTGTNFQYRLYGKFVITSFDIFQAEWFTGDFDRNGISDVLLFDEKSGDWVLMQGGVSGSTSQTTFTFHKISTQFQNLFRDDYISSTSSTNSPGTRDLSLLGKDRGKIQFFQGDYNGDGATDISFYDARSGKWWVGEVKFQVSSSEFQGQSSEEDEITIEWKIYKTFNAPEQALFANDRFSGDFNGDGFADFLLFDRDKGDWWLGEVKNSELQVPSSGLQEQSNTIEFKKWSSVPQHKNITRWLQGDFNGDGRTDIGFYNSSDNNFWIGEASLTGFRYRIYSSLNSGGPSPERVLTPPLPKDQVQIGILNRYVPVGLGTGTVRTNRLQFAFDANPNTDRGELPFAGCFTGNNCLAQPELLLFDRRQSKMLFKKFGNVNVSDALNLNLAGSNVTLLTQRSGWNQDDGKEEILFYQEDTVNHSFKSIRHQSGISFASETLGSFQKTSGSITNFKIHESLHLVGRFNTNSGPQVLILDDQAPTAQFKLFWGAGSVTTLSIESRALNASHFKDIFKSSGGATNRFNRKMFTFFAGNFGGGTGVDDILMVDKRTLPHKWYRGVVNTTLGSLSFTQLTANNQNLPVEFSQAGIVEYPELNHTQKINLGGNIQEVLLYTTLTTNATYQFHRIYISGNTLQLIHHSPLSSDHVFDWQFDHLGRPLVTSPGNSGSGTPLLKAVQLNGNTSALYQLISIGSQDPGFPAVVIDRPDLYQKIYPFQWIQGDYNGDSKTDLGFFHLKESVWYFAATTGTVPDLITKVENGLGGHYEFTYTNSTSFDNTGSDSIPDLPMNYKVCTQQIQDDGQNNRITWHYEYRNGFAHSGYYLTPSPLSTIGADGSYRKETDFFGFSEFTVRDAFGAKTISLYHTTPFAHYLPNRALNGAIKERRQIGWDLIEYDRTEYHYEVHGIFPTAGSSRTLVGSELSSLNLELGPSLLAVLVKEDNFHKGVKTAARQINPVYQGYFLQSQSLSETDFYADALHQPTTRTTMNELEIIPATNQQRTKNSIHLQGSSLQLTTTYQYDSRGNITRESITDNASKVRTWQNQFNGFGNLIARENISASPSRRVEFGYDPILEQYPALERMVGQVNVTQQANYNYASAFGRASETIDPNGNKTYFEYDGKGRIVRVRADQTSVETLAEYTYSVHSSTLEVLSNPLKAKTIQYAGFGQPSVETTVYADGLGREIHSVRSASGSGSTNGGGNYVKSGRKVYDALGRVIRQSQTSWAQDDEIDTFRHDLTEKNPTLTQYDPIGRVSKTTLPAGYIGEPETSFRYTYNGAFEVTETHSIGRGKKTIQNARGEVLYVEDFGTSTGSPISTTMSFCYDIAGNRIKRSDGNVADCGVSSSTFEVQSGDASGNNISFWKYDAFGQQLAVSDPDTGVTQYTYNIFGDLTQKTDSLNRTTTMVYDRLGRITQKNLPDDEGNVFYTYDSLGGSSNAIGRLVAVEDGAQRKEFSYDQLGRAQRESRRIKDNVGTVGPPFVTAYRYDLLDRSVEIDYPEDPTVGYGIRVCYAYNAFGLVASTDVNLSHSGTGCNDKTIISQIVYNEFGQIDSLTRGNGIRARYEYDQRRRVSQLTYANGITDLVTTQYTYDIQNSITKKETTPIGSTTFQNYSAEMEYVYDGLNRLVSAKGQTLTANVDSGHQPHKFKHNYAYALNGNLTQKEFIDFDTDSLQDRWTYSYNNHKVTGIHTTAFDGNRFALNYDAAGNTIHKTDQTPQQKAYKESAPPAGPLSKTMTYDSYNRIIQVSNAATNETMGSYSYDDQGFRVRKVSKESIEGQVRTIELEYPNKYFGIERQRDAVGQSIPNTEYSVNNIYLDGVRIAALVPSGHARYFLTDQVDSVHVVTNDAGQAINRTEYLPYGDTWFVEGEKSYAPKYNSQELDKESDLYFFNARHYDPEIARFTTADTVVDGEYTIFGWNRYMYVHGNPVMYKDPSGNCVGGLFSFFSATCSGSVKENTREDYQVERGALTRSAETIDALDYSPSGIVNKMIHTVASSLSGEKDDKVSRKERAVTGLFSLTSSPMNGALRNTSKAAPATRGSAVTKTGANGGGAKVKPSELTPTHKSTLSKSKYKNLKESIDKEGIKEPIKYVSEQDKKMVVDGHHRLKVAKELQLKEVPAEKVELPYKGYKESKDLFDWSR